VQGGQAENEFALRGQSLDASTLQPSCGSVEGIRFTEAPPVFSKQPAFLAVASIGVAASGLLVASCSSSSAPPSVVNTVEAGLTPQLLDPGCTAGGLTVSFNPMYSAFDGTHVFQLPATVVGSDQQVTWFGDSSMVGMMADLEAPNEVLLTMLKPGVTTIHVQSPDGKCGSALLTISAALESDWEIGNKRYNDGTSVHLAGPPKQGTGSPLESAGMVGPACTNCHGETATNSVYTDVSHTPEQTGGFSDEDLLNIILRGTFPDNGAAFDWNIVPYPVWQNFHRWTDITTDQQAGIIAYLRSITPAPQKGKPNFLVYQDAGMAVVVTDAAAPMDAAAEVSGGNDANDASELPETNDAAGTPDASDAGVGEGEADGAGASEGGDAASE
jgi:hypothetical protein